MTFGRNIQFEVFTGVDAATDESSCGLLNTWSSVMLDRRLLAVVNEVTHWHVVTQPTTIL